MTKDVSRVSSPFAEMLDWLDSGAPFGLRSFGLTPYVRVEDFVEDDTYVLRAEMPGIDPDKDVTVSVEDDTLTIRGERREEEKDKHHREFHYGSFTRSITLPRGVKAEEITASYTDGVLEVRVPKAAEESSAVKVPVRRQERTPA
jgi:HSP20 family molecular chaperone IbpA